MSFTPEEFVGTTVPVEEVPPEQVTPVAAAPVEASPTGGFTPEEFVGTTDTAVPGSAGATTVPYPGLGGVPEYEAQPGPVEQGLQNATDAIGGLLGTARDAVAPTVTNAVESPVGQAIGGVLGTPIPGTENLPPPPTALGQIASGGAPQAAEAVRNQTGVALDAAARGEYGEAALQATQIGLGQAYNASQEAAGERVIAGLPAQPTYEEIVADPTQLVALPAGGGTQSGDFLRGKFGLPDVNAWYNSLPPEEQAALAAQGGLAVMTAWQESNPQVATAAPPPQLSNPLDATTGSNPLTSAVQIAGAVPASLGGWLQSGQQGTLGPFLAGMLGQASMDPAFLIPPAVGEEVARLGVRAARNLPGVRSITALAPEEATRLAGEENLAALGEATRADLLQNEIPAPPAATIPAAGPVTPGTGAIPTPSNGRQGVGASPRAVPDPGQLTPPPTNGRAFPSDTGSVVGNARRATGVATPTERVHPTTGQIGVPAGRVGRSEIVAFDDGLAIYGPDGRLRQAGIQSENTARRLARELNAPDDLMEGVSAPLTGTPLPTRETVDLANSLRRHLDAAGLGDVNLGIVPKLTDLITPEELRRLSGVDADLSGVGGAHFPNEKLIVLAMEHADDAVFGRKNRMGLTLDHEIVHSLRSLDLFTPDEWGTLLRTAQDLRIIDDADLFNPAYRKLTGDALDGELVAHLYEYYRMGRLTDMHPAASLLERIKVFLQSLGLALRETYPDAQRVMQQVEAGEIGARERGVARSATPKATLPEPVADAIKGTEPDFSAATRRSPEPKGGYDATPYRRALEGAQPYTDDPALASFPEFAGTAIPARTIFDEGAGKLASPHYRRLEEIRRTPEGDRAVREWENGINGWGTPAPVARIPLDPAKATLVSTQETLDVNTLRYVAEHPETISREKMPQAYKQGDRYTVVDGHHRVAAGRINGDDSVPAFAFDLDNVRALGDMPEPGAQFSATRRAVPEPENPVSTPDVVGDGRAFMNPLLREQLIGTRGPGAAVPQETLDRLFTEIDEKYGGILSKNMEEGGKFNKVDKETGERYNLRLWDADTIRRGLEQDWRELLWYEDGAAMMNDVIDVPPEQKNQFYNTVAATSQNMKPGRNWKLALSTFAEKMQGKAIRTVSLTPEKVADGFADAHHSTPKFYNFANTPKYLTGMIDTPPGPTLDLQFARSIGLMDNAALDGKIYDALAEWVSKVRDEVNAGNAAIGAPPLQTWNIQSAMWVLQRKAAGITDIGDSFSQHIPATIAEIKRLGIPLGPGDRITMETLRDPRMVTAFGETADFVRNQPISQFNPARTRFPEIANAYQTRDGLMATPNPRSPKGASMWDQKIPGSNQSRRTSFTTSVRTPLLSGVSKRLVPEIHKAITGTAVTGRAISQDVMSTATDVFETMMLIPRGGTANTHRIIADHPFMGALIAKHFDIPSVKTRRYQDITPESGLPVNGYRAFIDLPPGERMSEEALQRISDRAGVNLTAEHHRTGGVELVTQNEPSDIPDLNALTDAILSEYPTGRGIDIDEQHVSYSEAKGSDYERIKGELISQHRYSQQLQTAAGRKRAQTAIDAVTRAERVAADLAEQWRRNSADWDAAHRDAVSPAARDALNALRAEERNRTLQYSARAGFGNRQRATPYVTNTVQNTPDPNMRRGVLVSTEAARHLDRPVDGLVKFADGYRPTGMSLADFHAETTADFNTWLGGLNADGTKKPWTSQNKKWIALDKRFNPDGTADIGALAPNTRAGLEARATFLDDTFAAAVERGRAPAAKQAGVIKAWDSYTSGMRQTMLFNWLNAPRYVLQNLITNSINITARGGGIRVALDVFTDLPEWGRSFRNLKDPTSATTADAILKAAGVGDRPNVRMNPKTYYDRVGGKAPKWMLPFTVTSKILAPETLRFGASTPDQLGRLHVFSNEAWRGYKRLNDDLVGIITSSPEWKKMGQLAPPDAKVRQVVRDFLDEKSALIDPNTGTPYTNILGRTKKYTPVWQADDLANTLAKRLTEDMSIKPGGTEFRNAVERVRRVTKDETRSIIDNANAMTDSALFSWRNTQGDQLLGRATLFHYWMTRQGGLYVSEALAHPWIATGYGRMMEEMQTQAEELGQPQWMIGWFQFMKSVGGFSTWFSPFDVVQSLLTFPDWMMGDEQSSFTDLTRLGQGASAIPFFIHPFIQGVAYELGLLGPDYPAPPLTGAETFGSKAIDLLNLANAQGQGFMEPFNALGIGVDADGNKVPIPRKPLQELYARVGNAISTALEPITGLSPVEVANSAGSIDRNIQTIGEQQTRTMHPDWDTHEVFTHVTDVMMDHSSTEYQDWYRQSSESAYQMGGGLPAPLAALGRIASPVQMTTMPEQRALDTMEGLQPSGQIPVRPLPTTDREAEIYNESKYGASKTVEGRQLQSMNIEFGGLVEPALDEARDLASAIYGMRVEETVTAGGYEYTPEDIANMTNDERYALGDQVLLDAGYTREDVEAAYADEDAYLAAHPDYAQFREYRQLVYDHPGNPALGIPPGPQGFVMETALTNPGFAQYVRSDMTDHLTGEIDYGKATFTDAYLAAQGVRPSVYSPLVGNEPSTAPGGYPSLAGADPTQPLLPLTTPTADIPIYSDPGHPGQIAKYGAAYVDDVRVADPRIATLGPGTPLQMLGRDEKTGMVKVSVGGTIGYADPAMLETVQPPGPAPAGQAAPVAPSGGLGAVGGAVMDALGAGKDALGRVVGSMLGMPTVASKPATTSLGVAPGSYDVAPAIDGLGVQSTAAGSDRTWMEFMYGGNALVTTEYKGPPTANMDYQLGHGATNTNHAAYDIGCQSGDCYGTPIKSPVSGKVVCAGYGAGTGEALGSPQCTYSQNMTSGNRDGTPAAHDVVIEVGRDEQGNPIQLSFSHVGKSDLKPGQTVSVGDVIGSVGDTGGGPHTHLEGWVGDPAAGYTLVDPQLVVGGYYGPVESAMTAAPAAAPATTPGLPLPTLDWLGGITGKYDQATPPTLQGDAGRDITYADLPTAGGDWSVLDQFNAAYPAASQAVQQEQGVAPPPDLIKAMNAMESGYGQVNPPTGVRNDVRNQPLAGFVGVFKDAADSWGVDFNRMTTDPEYAIYGMATGLGKIANWDASQYDPSASGSVLDNWGWDGVMAIYYSGQPFLDAPQPADDSTTVRQYVENINAMRAQLV